MAAGPEFISEILRRIIGEILWQWKFPREQSHPSRVESEDIDPLSAHSFSDLRPNPIASHRRSKASQFEVSSPSQAD
jgi:hypothetical protein